MRLPLAVPLDSRNSSEAIDARLFNMMVENYQGKPYVVNRAALIKAATQAGSANGLAAFNGELISLFGANFYERGGVDFEVTPSVASIQFEKVVFGNGRFVLIGSSGINNPFYYSDNGIKWTASTAAPGGITQNWEDLTYGNGRFVAVNYDGDGNSDIVVGISEDGISWSKVSTGIDTSSVLKCAFGNGIFVIISKIVISDAVAYYSTDNGQTWAQGTITYGGALSDLSVVDIVYGNGTFVASVGSQGFLYSTDGMNWSSSTASEANPWAGIAYGNGKFVSAASTGTNRIAYSSDGVTWSVAAASSVTNWNRVAYIGGSFVAFAQTSTFGLSQLVTMSSVDGATWVSETTPTYLVASSYGVGAGNEKIIVTSGSSSNGTLAVATLGLTQVGGTLTDAQYDFAQTST